MAVTDLTGTKWQLNIPFSVTSGYGQFTITGSYMAIVASTGAIFTYPLHDTANNFRIGYDVDKPSSDYIYLLFYGDPNSSSGVSGVLFRKTSAYYSKIFLTITGGVDATNPLLIAWIEANATQIIETTPTTITYNGTELASLEEGQTATFPQGVKAKTDVAIAFGSKGSITYKGVTTEIEAGKTANLLCAGKKFATDVVVAVESGEDTDPYGLIGEWIFNSTIKTFPAQYNFDFETATGTAYVGIKGVGNRFLQYVYADGSVDTVYDKDYKGFDVYGANRIFISGGVDITNETFATWLKANATKQ